MASGSDWTLTSSIVSLLCVLIYLLHIPVPLVELHRDVGDIPHQEVENWANSLGVQLWVACRKATRDDTILNNYKGTEQGADLQKIDGLRLVQQMAKDMEQMMSYKEEAITRIMDISEQASLSHKYERHPIVDYYNSKKINDYPADSTGTSEDYKNLNLSPNRHFDYIPVNMNVSALHLPTNVYDRAPDVLNAIEWSAVLDKTFVTNYMEDPSLTWQYLCSATGFLRQFPAVKWKMDELDPDLYDCRMRSWYIQASNSPKDMVILLDTSGSMTGERKEISKHVVLNLLDTLNGNDYVNVFSFSEEAIELVPCFKDQLVQANLENIREFKSAMEHIETENIANFTDALTKGFELLRKYNHSGEGTQCNQAIMLITDGAPYNYKEIFQEYNWPQLQVRVFTYLIGREVTDMREVNWMACANKGYFVHVDTLSEVKEQVQKYIPVMARPMVMYQNYHPKIWTAVYADVTGLDVEEHKKYRFMTTVATPVYDRRNYSVRVANLLGVVGTDLPIKEIESFAPAYQLGVNGYSFIVTNNGYILYHPDLRPLFNGILKPNYNSVDLAEVELLDNEEGPRYNDSTLFQDMVYHKLRRDMVDKVPGETKLNVKIHLDKMKRVTTRKQLYFYSPIGSTPFSLGIALPDNYGIYRIKAQTEIHLARDKMNVSEFFAGEKWTIHPDWIYCRYRYEDKHPFQSPEEELVHFLDKVQKPGWKWHSIRVFKHTEASNRHGGRHQEEDAYYCDKDLFQSVVFDAKVTDVFSAPMRQENDMREGESLFALYGIVHGFVSTHSGFTRWFDSPLAMQENSTDDNRRWHQMFNKATDEVWYKRAVDFHEKSPDSFVFSVPFNAGDDNSTLVTGTKAIFIESKGHKSPAAVVGVQFKYAQFAEIFFNVTKKCPRKNSDCKTCSSEDINCYLLDDNGFVVVSENFEDTGRFFGEVDGTIMDSLVQDQVYKRIRIYDYQGVCLDAMEQSGSASILMTPFRYMYYGLMYMWDTVIWAVFHLSIIDIIQSIYVESQDSIIIESYDDDDTELDDDDNSDENEELSEEYIQDLEDPTLYKMAYINKTTPRGCDQEVDLYSLQPERFLASRDMKPLKGKLTNCLPSGCEKAFSAMMVNHTNLLLVVVQSLCPCEGKSFGIEPTEIGYNESMSCDRLRLNIYRRQPGYCISYHPEETDIKLCGGTGSVHGSMFGVVFLMLFLTYLS